ncbi:tetratricopeptide repeat protein [Marinospirillum celere]|uniref:tetratricopeptide repeat protein n=1 Tax=Marinospirillum celere TaxID=1122252 RepID=UPI0015A4F7C7|nr:tetratricopeptide repeat protein [Marinospirillum celere]
MLTACASSQPAETSTNAGQPVESTSLYIHDRDTQLPEVQGLNQNLVFGLLSAELAGQRNQLNYALETYLQLAIETRDPGLAERATWIAQFARQPQQALQAAILWANTAPNNPDAQRTAAGLLLQNEHYLEAFDHLLRYERLGGESNYSLLAGHLAESANPVIGELYKLMLQESQQREEPTTDLLTALALLSEESGNLELAKQHLNQALGKEPNNVRALQLRARIYRQQGRVEAAQQLLEEALHENPEEVRLWLELARTQLQNQQLEAAEQSFERIISLQPDNPQIRLALARIQLETEQFEAARTSLLALTDDELLADQAYIHLAELAEREGQIEQALDYYYRVQGGQALLEAARARVDILTARSQHQEALEYLNSLRLSNPELTTPLTLQGEQLHRQQERFEEAIKWIDQGRKLLPDNQESLRLLYARALLNYELKQLDAMEADLRLLLATDPDNAMALNALGYTLVNLTDDRIEEGLELIKKAYQQNPESPEILDSLGWALYRLGRLEEAREYLEEAFQRLPDEEIAAHLAETLWDLGENLEARNLLYQMLDSQEATPTIDDLLQRRPQLIPQP